MRHSVLATVCLIPTLALASILPRQQLTNFPAACTDTCTTFANFLTSCSASEGDAAAYAACLCVGTPKTGLEDCYNCVISTDTTSGDTTDATQAQTLLNTYETDCVALLASSTLASSAAASSAVAGSASSTTTMGSQPASTTAASTSGAGSIGVVWGGLVGALGVAGIVLGA